MENYPSNSKHQRSAPKEAQKPEIKPVVSGEVVRRKKPVGQKVTELFVGGDSRSVWGYVAYDVLLPAAKDAVSSAISQGIDMLLFGDTRNRRGSSRPPIHSTSSYTSYNRIRPRSPFDREREEPRREISRQARATHDFDQIVLQTRAEADEVLDGMFNLINEYDTATVADLYGFLGLTGSFVDEKYGWTDLRNADVSRVRGGYLLNLPRPEVLD